MSNKYYIIIAHDGTEVIDNTPEAESRIAALDDLDRKSNREHRRQTGKTHGFKKNPLWKFVCSCGLV